MDWDNLGNEFSSLQVIRSRLQLFITFIMMESLFYINIIYSKIINLKISNYTIHQKRYPFDI